MNLSRLPGHFFLILACICYAFEWWMVQELHILGASSYDITFYKGFFTILLIGTYLAFTGQIRSRIATIEKRNVLPILVFSLIFLYGNTAYAEALTHTKVMNILILIYLNIFLGILAGRFFLKEQIHGQTLLWAILAFSGIILTLYSGEYQIQFGIGEILALTIACTLTATAMIVKWTSNIETWFRLFIAYSIGTGILGIIIIYQGGLLHLFSDPRKIAMGILFAIATGILGRGLKDLGTKSVPMHTVGIIMLLEPILQILTSAIYGGQIPSVVNGIGILLIIGSVIGVTLSIR